MFNIGASISKKVLSITKKDISKEEFVDLIELNKVSLYRFAKSILKSNIEAEDALSESILKAYTNRNKLKSVNSFKPWMMKITANECYTILKKNSRFELRDDLEYLDLVSVNEEINNLRDVVENLDEKFSSVIVLYYYEDMSIKDISKILKLSEGTVKSRLSRAKSKLKVLLEKEV